MRHWTLSVAALVLLAAPPARACTIRPQSFNQIVQRLEGEAWAVYARPSFRFDRWGDGRSAGTATLRSIRCLRMPRGRANCPQVIRLSFAYESIDDGASCPVALASLRPDEPNVLRYFILYRSDEGRWSLVTARQNRSRVLP